MTEKGSTTASISIHALTRSATLDTGILLLLYRYFNPRTHEECDGNDCQSTDHLCKISIHALTRSATCITFRVLRGTMISIHALTRSATKKGTLEYGQSIISIHALTRSATSFLIIKRPTIKYFNPRTHEECDHASTLRHLHLHHFNPRTHEKCDR